MNRNDLDAQVVYDVRNDTQRIRNEVHWLDVILPTIISVLAASVFVAGVRELAGCFAVIALYNWYEVARRCFHQWLQKRNQEKCRKRLATGEHETVAGFVENHKYTKTPFIPLPVIGFIPDAAEEEFVVAGVSFSTSSSSSAGGYRPEPNGRPLIANGMIAEVAYLGGSILRIVVCKVQSPARDLENVCSKGSRIAMPVDASSACTSGPAVASGDRT